jgi:hypothetical protein
MSDLHTLFKDLSSLSTDEIAALSEYKKSIEFLSSDKSNLEFNNKDHFHAALVMSQIFKTVKYSLKIFTGRFSGEISDNPVYFTQLKEAIKTKNINIEVVFEEDPNKDSLCLKTLRELKNEGKKVSLSVLNKNYLKDIWKNSLTLGHFVLGDDHMFRYETDKKKFKAFCNFDDKKSVSQLATNFSILRLNSTPTN